MMMDPYRVNNCDDNWNGEYAGKWVDAASMIVSNTNNDALKTRLNSFVNQFKSYQDPDGYFGCNTIKGGRWDIWNQWCSIYAMVGYYEQFGDTSCLNAAWRAAKNIIKTWSPITSSTSPFFTDNDDQAGGLHTGVLGDLLTVYEYVGDTTILNFVKAGLTYSPILVEMRSTGKARVMHCYPLQSTWGGAAKLSTITQIQSEFTWMLGAWNDMVDRHQYPVGGFGCNEILSPTSPNNSENVNQMETCATMEWIILNKRLYRATGDIRYVHALEKTLYNILLCEQNEDGTKFQYYTPMRSDKSLPGPTSCCYWSGPRVMAMLPQLIYAYDNSGIRVDFLEQSTFSASINGTDFSLAQTTEFPAQGNSKIIVTSTAPVSFTMKIRIPTWARNPTVSINGGASITGVTAGQYAIIQRSWNNGDYADVKFNIPVTRKIFHDYSQSAARADKNGCIVRGAEVLALDSRDNPTLDLDLVILPDTLSLSPTTNANGRLRYTGVVDVGGIQSTVTFTPFSDAGTNNVRYRTVFPTGITFAQFPLKFLGTPIVSVPNPTGAGSRKLNLIRDDQYPDPAISSFGEGFDTFDNTIHPSDYFGYTFTQIQSFSDATYTFGVINDVGGPFETVRVQVRNNGQWNDVANVTITPSYSSATVKPFTSYKFSFSRVSGDGIRIIGKPRNKFIACSELDVNSSMATGSIVALPRIASGRVTSSISKISVYDVRGRLVNQTTVGNSRAMQHRNQPAKNKFAQSPYVVVTLLDDRTLRTTLCAGWEESRKLIEQLNSLGH